LAIASVHRAGRLEVAGKGPPLFQGMERPAQGKKLLLKNQGLDGGGQGAFQASSPEGHFDWVGFDSPSATIAKVQGPQQGVASMQHALVRRVLYTRQPGQCDAHEDGGEHQSVHEGYVPQQIPVPQIRGTLAQVAYADLKADRPKTSAGFLCCSHCVADVLLFGKIRTGDIIWPLVVHTRSGRVSCRQVQGKLRMKKEIAGASLFLTLMCSPVMAGERATDAALGAVSGAVVLGPVGAVAGAVIGYTAGPSISSSWA
jgi:hypothetical protein